MAAALATGPSPAGGTKAPKGSLALIKIKGTQTIQLALQRALTEGGIVDKMYIEAHTNAEATLRKASEVAEEEKKEGEDDQEAKKRKEGDPMYTQVAELQAEIDVVVVGAREQIQTLQNSLSEKEAVLKAATDIARAHEIIAECKAEDK